MISSRVFDVTGRFAVFDHFFDPRLASERGNLRLLHRFDNERLESRQRKIHFVPEKTGRKQRKHS